MGKLGTFADDKQQDPFGIDESTNQLVPTEAEPLRPVGRLGVFRPSDDEASINVRNALSEPSDVRLRNRKLSEETGIPVQAVASGYQQVKKENDIQKLNLPELRKTKPVLWRMLNEQANADRMVDDIPLYKTIEETLRDVGNVFDRAGDSFESGINIIRLGEIGRKDAFSVLGLGDPLSPEEIAERDTLIEFNSKAARANEGQGVIADVITGTAEQAPIIGNVWWEGLKGNVTGKVVGATVGAGAGALTLNPAGIVAGARTGFAVGGKIGEQLFKAAETTEIELGNAFNDYKLIEGVDQEMAARASVVYGVVAGSLEFIGLGSISKTLTPVKKLIKQRIQKAMGTETGRQVITGIFKQYVKAISTESVTEGAQELLQIFGNETLRVFGDDQYDDDSWLDVLSETFNDANLEQVGDATYKAATSTFGTTTITSSISAIAASRNNKKIKAASEQQKIDRLKNAIDDSNIKNEGQETDIIKQYMQETLEQYGGEDTVFLPSEDVTEELLEGFEGEAFDIMREQLKQANELGVNSDIAVPLAVFSADVMTNDEAYTVLRDSIRLSTESLTNSEAARIDSENTELVQKIVEEAKRTEQEYEDAKVIWDEITKQISDTQTQPQATARVSASIIPAYVVTRAKRQGKTVNEVYEELGVTVLNGKQPIPNDRDIISQALKSNPDFTKQFLDVLPEDATVEEVKTALNDADFTTEQRNFIKALEADDWLGFDNPVQAINALASEEQNTLKISLRTKQALSRLTNKSYEQLGEYKVNIPTEDVNTGEKGTVETTAKEALTEVDENLTTLKEILSCLGS